MNLFRIFRDVKRLIRNMIKAERYQIRTHVLCQVLSYDEVRNTVSVQPVTKFQRTTGDTLEWIDLPVVNDVPVVLSGSGLFFLTYPIYAGSYGLLHISDRTITDFLIAGGTVQPTSYRCHALTDAIFQPTILPLVEEGTDENGLIEQAISTNSIQLRTRSGDTRISIGDDETISISNAKCSIGIDVDGNIAITTDGDISASAANSVEVSLGGDSLALGGNGGSTTLTIGDGAVSVAIAENLQTYIDNVVKTLYDAHTHPTGTGPSGPPAVPLTQYAANITSSKVTIPNG